MIYLSRQDRSASAQGSCGSMTEMREELIVRLLFGDTSRKGDDRLAESKMIFEQLAFELDASTQGLIKGNAEHQTRQTSFNTM